MDSELYKNIANSTAHRTSREQNAHFILNNPELFSDFLKLAFDTNDKNHHKACWVLELVLEEKLHFLTPFIDQFCDKISNYTNESALRSISKICLFLAKHISLSNIQNQKIIEACFDWLIIENGKVATKAYAIRALFEFGKKSDWIYPELQRILSEDYVKHSAAYKAVAREILKKIK